MSLSIVAGVLTGFAGLLALKALSANYLYILVIVLSIGIAYGALYLVHNTSDNKFKLPTGRVLYTLLIASVIVGLLSGLITIRLLYL